MKTFYFACSSEHSQEAIRKGNLLSELGYDWSFQWPGTEASVREEIQGPGRLAQLARAGLTCEDLAGAVRADLFILYLTPTPSPGGFMELGARLGANKQAFVIMNGQPDHLFYDHPCVLKVPDWLNMMKFLRLEK